MHCTPLRERPIFDCFPRSGRERRPTFAISIGPSARVGAGIALAAAGGPRCSSILRVPGCPHRLPVLSGPGPLRLPIATVQDCPADRLRVGPVIANDDPERRSRTAFPRNGPGLTADAQLIGLWVECAVPDLQ